MNNHEPESERLDDEMLAEYDFTGGVRGKHHEAYRQGHTVTIHQTDGTTVVQTFSPADEIVLLDPDVRAYFPDSEAVNRALRTLISLFPQSQEKISS
jgi:hypothetical protein